MRIAVIGHGRSPEGMKWGEKIDSTDLVVRMWDWDWQTSADYGSRFDYGMVATSAKQVSAWLRFRSSMPAKGWLAFLRDGRPAPQGFEPVDPSRWNIMAAHLGSLSGSALNLTRGCAAACWSIEKAGPGGEVILVGFDNLRRQCALPIDEAFGPEYLKRYDIEYPGWRSGKTYRAGERRCGSHDLGVELPLLTRLAQQNDVTLSFADLKWRPQQ